MAVSDQKIEALTKSLEGLVKEIRNKNGFGGRDDLGETRMGRGGSANAANTRDIARNSKAVAEGLEELHSAMSSGGSTIADHFQKLARNLDPLNRVFGRLEDAVTKASVSHGKAYASSARVAYDYVRAMNGNIKNIKEANELYGEFTATLQEIADNRADAEKNQAVHNARVKKLFDLREKLLAAEIKDGNGNVRKLIDLTDGLNAPLKKFIDSIGSDKTLKMTKLAAEGVEKAAEKFKGFNEVTTTYMKGISDELQEGRRKLEKATDDMVSAIKSGFAKDLAMIPSIIGDRLRQGFESNEFMQAIRLGISPQELNKFRSDNRFMLGALGDFGKSVDLVADGTVTSWSEQYKKVGLIGSEATALLDAQLKSAQRQGIRFDKEINARILHDARIFQQAYGGNITEASATLNDFMSDIGTINRMNMAASDAERVAIREEITNRLVLNKQLGISIEFAKEQQRINNNIRYENVGDRFRKGYMTRFYLKQQNRRGANYSEEEIALAQRAATTSLTSAEDIKARDALMLKVGRGIIARDNMRSALTSQRDINRSLVRDIPGQVFRDASIFSDAALLGNAAIDADSNKRLIGNVTGDNFLKMMQGNVEKVDNSFTKFDLAVQEFRETMSGLGSNPGGGAASALIKGTSDIIMQALMYRFLGKSLGTVFGKGTGAASGVGRLANAIPGLSSVTGMGSKFAASGLGQGLGKAAAFGAKRIPVLGALIGGGISYADAVGGGKTQGAALSQAGGSAAGGFGGAVAGAAAGAAIGSVVPVLGTAVGGIIGGVLGGWGGSVLGEKIGEGAYDFFKSENNGVSSAADNMNNIIRDQNGNPVSQVPTGLPSPQESLAVIANNTGKQVALTEEEKLINQNRYEQQTAMAAERQSAAEHAAELASSYNQRWGRPAA